MIHAIVMTKNQNVLDIIESLPLGWSYEGQFNGDHKQWGGTTSKVNTDITIEMIADGQYRIKVDSNFLSCLETIQNKERTIDIMNGIKILYFTYVETDTLLFSSWTWNIYQN